MGNGALSREAKIRLIREINQLLVIHGREPVTPADFDILYDLDIDQLVETTNELKRNLPVRLSKSPR